jgi:ABC-type phosphate transport system substrate-binding protein
MTLVLDFETIASIYLNEITMWNDPRIQAINSPEVAAALPAQPITVITQSISSAITQLLTEMLSATVPRFAAAVRAFVELMAYMARSPPMTDYGLHTSCGHSVLCLLCFL